MKHIAILKAGEKNGVKLFFCLEYLIDGTHFKNGGGKVYTEQALSAKVTQEGYSIVNASCKDGKIVDDKGKFTRFEHVKKVNPNIKKAFTDTAVVLGEVKYAGEDAVSGYIISRFTSQNGKSSVNTNMVGVGDMLTACFNAKKYYDITPIQNMVYVMPTGDLSNGATDKGIIKRLSDGYELPVLTYERVKKSKPVKVREAQKPTQPVQPVKDRPLTEREKMIQEANSLGFNGLLSDAKMTDEQARIILDGRKSGIPTEMFASHVFPDHVMQHLINTIKGVGINAPVIRYLVQREKPYSVEQIEELVQGYEGGVDFSKYADPNTPAGSMRFERLNLESKKKDSFHTYTTLSDESLAVLAGMLNK